MSILLAIIFLIDLILPFLLLKSKDNIYSKRITMNLFTYVIGSLFLYRYSDIYEVSNETVRLFVIIILLGKLAYWIFYIISYKIFQNKKIKKLSIANYIKNYNKGQFFSIIMIFIGVLFILYSFKKMGFIPLFEESADAKYMSGIYRENYLSVAKYYRLALIIIPQFIIIYSGIGLIKNKNKFKLILLNFISFFILLLTKRRGIFGNIIVEYIFILSLISKKEKNKYYYLLLINIIFIVGILFNPIILYKNYGITMDMLNILLNSVPDISDNILFFNNLIAKQYFNYGRLIYGGLIANKYEWNPAVYSLLVINGDANVASGGIRILDPIYFYSFNGSIVIMTLCMAIKGYISGFMLYLNKIISNENNTENKIIYYLIFNYGYIILNSIFGFNLEVVISYLLFIIFVLYNKYKVII